MGENTIIFGLENTKIQSYDMLSHPLLVKVLFRGVNGACLDVCRGWSEYLCHCIDPNSPIQEETKVWGDVGLFHA